MTGLDNFPEWQFERCKYEGATYLRAARCSRGIGDPCFTVEVDPGGELVIDDVSFLDTYSDGTDRTAPWSLSIPTEVLRRLIADAIERKVPGWV